MATLRYDVTGIDVADNRLRDDVLTASDLAAAVGLNPHKTPAALYAEKEHQVPQTRRTSSVMRRGKLLEPIIVPLVQERFPEATVELAHDFLVDTEDHIGCTPDGYIHWPDGTYSTMQIKTVGRRTFKRTWANGVPDHVLLQALTEAMLAEAKTAVVVAFPFDEYSGFDEVELFIIDRDERRERGIRGIAREFHKARVEKRPPAFDYANDSDLIAALWPEHTDGKSVDLNGDNELPIMLEARENLIAEIETRETQKIKIDAFIRAKMQDAERAVCGLWVITLRTIIRKAHQVRESRYRRLLVSRGPKED